MASKYYIRVKSGPTSIFDGTLSEFKGKFYSYPADWTDEDIVESAREWAEDNNWSFEAEACH